MSFHVAGYSIIPYTLKCCRLIQQHQLAAECRVFRDNSAAEFHKLRHGIWQNLLWKNGGPVDDDDDDAELLMLTMCVR